MTTILRNSDHRRMAWKNGGGETAEVAVSPPDASMETFGWRISMATVAQDSPFSVFPGIDRTLALLDGAGMALQIDGRPQVTLTPMTPPIAFPADAPTMARLTAGPILDLNVMTRRGQYRHAVERLMIGETRTICKPPARKPFARKPPAVCVLLALGDVRAGPADLQRLDAIMLETNMTVSAERPTLTYVIRIGPV